MSNKNVEFLKHIFLNSFINYINNNPEPCCKVRMYDYPFYFICCIENGKYEYALPISLYDEVKCKEVPPVNFNYFYNICTAIKPAPESIDIIDEDCKPLLMINHRYDNAGNIYDFNIKSLVSYINTNPEDCWKKNVFSNGKCFMVCVRRDDKYMYFYLPWKYFEKCNCEVSNAISKEDADEYFKPIFINEV